MDLKEGISRRPDETDLSVINLVVTAVATVVVVGAIYVAVLFATREFFVSGG